MIILTERLSTPIGELILVTDDGGRVRALDWAECNARLLRLLRLHHGHDGGAIAPRADQSDAMRAVRRYFAGDLDSITTVAVETAGTPFQRAVWTALRDIPVGSTRSYAALAASIDRPRAVRAVGLANGANPIGIIVPCHRVVGSDASLTGYAGGLSRKRWLLEHEGAR